MWFVQWKNFLRKIGLIQKQDFFGYCNGSLYNDLKNLDKIHILKNSNFLTDSIEKACHK